MSAFGSNPMIPTTGNNNKNSNSNSNNHSKDRRRDNSKRKNPVHKGNFNSNSNNGSASSRNKSKPNSSSNGSQNNNFNRTNRKRGGFNVNRNANGPTSTNSIGGRDETEEEGEHENEDEMVEDALTDAKIIPKTTSKFQHFTNKEKTLTGKLVANPELLGFKPKTYTRREVPKFLQVQSRAVNPIAFKQDDWDKANQQKMLQMEQSNTGNDYQGIYEEFQRMRETERKKMEDLGLVDAENVRKDLNDAISFSGTCLDMCPIFERVRRALENNVKSLEKDPQTNRISRDKAIKAFSRPAAGQPPPLPSEVRPPFVLVKTLDYIIENVVPHLPEAHSFIWDRTRSIRQDFTYQNYYGPESIDCHERIVRIHLVSLHIMAGSDVEYSQQQELEQFNKALQTLMEIYQDVRNRGGKCPNEPEFRAYYLLSHLREPEVEREIQMLPNYIMNNKLVKLALRFRNLVSQNNLVERGYKNSIGALNLFIEFFRLVFNDETPFLMACLLETQFNEIRFYSLKSMTRGYHTKGKPYDGEILTSILGFDDVSQLVKFLKYYEVDVIHERGQGTNKTVLVDLVNKEKLETKYKLNSMSAKPKLSQFYCQKLDLKITKSLSEFINSGLPNDNLQLKGPNDLHVLHSNRNIFDRPEASVDITGKDSAEMTDKDAGEVKAGSLADFLSRPSTGQGFGFGSTNPPTAKDTSASAGFQFAKPAPTETTTTEPETTTTEPAAVPVKEPGFSFTKPVPAQTKPTIQPDRPKQSEPSRPTFNFNIATNPGEAKSGDTKSAAQKSVNFGLSKPAQINNDDSNSKPLVSFDTGKNEIRTLPVLSTKLESQSTQRKLKDSSNYSSAILALRDEIISTTITEELKKYLPKLIQYDNEVQGRSKIIDSLTRELYDAFINEIVYKLTLELRADHFYQTHLKRILIKQVRGLGAKLLQKQELKRKRKVELEGIKFMNGGGGLKRQLSNASYDNSNISSSSKRRNTWNYDISIDEIVDRRTEIEKLWEPIKFAKVIETCNANLKTKINANERVHMTGLILVEDWKLNYSKWLNNKLALSVNKEHSIYQRKVASSDGNLIIDFKSLPTKDYLNKQFFQDTSIIIFECGLLQESKNYNDINSKLQRDGLILTKILQLISKYGVYKLQVVVVYWDVTREGLGIDEIKKGLNLGHNKYHEIINQIIICDMSQDNINEILNEGFDKLSHAFTGELTKRGEKLQKSTGKLVPAPPDHAPNHDTPTSADTFTKPMSKINNDKFKAQERKLINKAKMDKRYSYLNHHSMNYSANQLINQLLNQQINRLLFNQLINQQLNKLILNLSMNQSINGSNTTANNSMNQTINSINNSNILDGNVSGLGRFGNEIIEESTPFNSPQKMKKSIGKSVPSNLQQLIDLTTKVKSKYKSEK